MQDKAHYLKMLKRYRKLNNADGIKATLEVLVKFDDKQLRLGDKFDNN